MNGAYRERAQRRRSSPGQTAEGIDAVSDTIRDECGNISAEALQFAFCYVPRRDRNQGGRRFHVQEQRRIREVIVRNFGRVRHPRITNHCGDRARQYQAKAG